MHRWPKMIFVPILLLLVSAPAAWAQAGSFEFGVGGGVTELDDNVGGEREFRAEVRGGYFITDHFQLEGQLLRVTSVFDLSLTAYMINGVFHFGTDQGIVPYVLVGAGVADLGFSGFPFNSSVDDQGTALQAAVGTRFFLGDTGRSVRLELSTLREDSFDEDSNYLSFTAGFNWRFGG